MSEHEHENAPEPPPDVGDPGTSEVELAIRPDLAATRQLGWWLSLAEAAQDSERARGAAAAWRIAAAQDLGLKLVAAAELSVIRGKLQVSARLLRALALREGYTVVKVDPSDTECTAVIYDADGRELGRETFHVDQAEKAGLIKPKSAWETHPGRMCWARASSWVIYDYAPTVALGMVTEEELGDFVELPDSDVTEEPEPEPEPEGGGSGE